MRKSFNADAVMAAGSNTERSHQDAATARVADVHAWAVRTLARNGFGGEFITAGPGGSTAASLNTPAVAANASVRRLVAAIRRRRAAH